MRERSLAKARERQEAWRAYIRIAAGNGGGVVELERVAMLNDRVLGDDKYAAKMAKPLAGVETGG